MPRLSKKLLDVYDVDELAAIGVDGSLIRDSSSEFCSVADGKHDVTVGVEPPLIH